MVDARLGSEFRDARGRASGDRTFRLIGTCWNKDLPDSVGGANPETPPLWPDGITPEMLGPQNASYSSSSSSFLSPGARGRPGFVFRLSDFVEYVQICACMASETLKLASGDKTP